MTKTTNSGAKTARTKAGNTDNVERGDQHGLQWTGVVHTRRHRWWWYVGLVLVAAWSACVAIAADALSALPVILLTVVALVMYARRPERTTAYTLSDDGVLIDRSRRLVLADFKCFDLEEQPTSDAKGNDVAVVLVPMQFYAPGYLITLSESVDEGIAVVEAIGEHLPYRPIADPALARAINKLIRWMRIV